MKPLILVDLKNAKPILALIDGQFAIRVFLLCYLGYEGKVRDYRQVIHEPISHKNISEYKLIN